LRYSTSAVDQIASRFDKFSSSSNALHATCKVTEMADAENILVSARASAQVSHKTTGYESRRKKQAAPGVSGVSGASDLLDTSGAIETRPSDDIAPCAI
jgi:hypothetical protein